MKQAVSKEHSEFPTFENERESDIFELSSNENGGFSFERSKSHKKRESRKCKNLNNNILIAKENQNPNEDVVKPQRSRVQEFESLRRKGKENLPKNLKSRSGSRSKRSLVNSTAKKSAKKSSMLYISSYIPNLF